MADLPPELLTASDVAPWRPAAFVERWPAVPAGYAAPRFLGVHDAMFYTGLTRMELARCVHRGVLPDKVYRGRREGWLFNRQQLPPSLAHYPEGTALVYCVGDPGSGGNVKIGVTTDFVARFAALLTMNPGIMMQVRIVAAPPHVERLLHDRFEALRWRGEWFRDDGISYFMEEADDAAFWVMR